MLASAASAASALGKAEVERVARPRRRRSAWSTRNSQRLPSGDIRAYRLEDAPPVRGPCRTFAGFASSRSASRSISGVDLVVGGLDRLLRRRPPAARGRPAPPRSTPPRSSATNASCSWPVAARYCAIVAPCASSRCDEVVEAALHLLLRRAARGSRCRPRSAAASSTLSRTAICACTLRDELEPACGRRSRSSSTVSNSLTSDAHSSVASGRTLRLVSFTRTWKATSSPARSPKRSGSASLNLRMSPGRLPRELGVELGHDELGADLVEEVGGGEAVDHLVVDVALDVDLGVVAVGEGRGRVLEVGEALAQGVDLARRRPRRGPPDVGTARPASPSYPLSSTIGPHLDDGVELDVAVSSPAVMSISGGAIVSSSSRSTASRVVVGQRVPQRLLPGDVGAEPGLEQPAGRLAGTEAGDLAPRGRACGTRRRWPSRTRLGDRDVQPDLVAVERLDGRREGWHGEGSVPNRPLGSRPLFAYAASACRSTAA